MERFDDNILHPGSLSLKINTPSKSGENDLNNEEAELQKLLHEQGEVEKQGGFLSARKQLKLDRLYGKMFRQKQRRTKRLQRRTRKEMISMEASRIKKAADAAKKRRKKGLFNRYSKANHLNNVKHAHMQRQLQFSPNATKSISSDSDLHSTQLPIRLHERCPGLSGMELLEDDDDYPTSASTHDEGKNMMADDSFLRFKPFPTHENNSISENVRAESLNIMVFFLYLHCGLLFQCLILSISMIINSQLNIILTFQRYLLNSEWKPWWPLIPLIAPFIFLIVISFLLKSSEFKNMIKVCCIMFTFINPVPWVIWQAGTFYIPGLYWMHVIPWNLLIYALSMIIYFFLLKKLARIYSPTLVFCVSTILCIWCTEVFCIFFLRMNLVSSFFPLSITVNIVWSFQYATHNIIQSFAKSFNGRDILTFPTGIYGCVLIFWMQAYGVHIFRNILIGLWCYVYELCNYINEYRNEYLSKKISDATRQRFASYAI